MLLQENVEVHIYEKGKKWERIREKRKWKENLDHDCLRKRVRIAEHNLRHSEMLELKLEGIVDAKKPRKEGKV